ncbi:MAG: Ig-like domain-containing protein [Alphaproteobacteria bacterium]|nr:Ig-like domain-containing protein [Alphaproteobacteria bacterium]
MLPSLKTRLRSPLLLAALAAPAVIALATPAPAWAQGQAVFAEPFVQLLPTGPVYADGATPVTLHALMLAPDGTPYVGMRPKVTAKDGQVDGWTELGDGLYAFTYVPPKRDAEAATTVSLKGKTPDKGTLDKTFSVKLSPPMPTGMSITATPAELVLGQDRSLSLSFRLGGGTGQPEVGAKLKAIASAGKVENLTYLGGGMFTALYTPPAVIYPHVAVVTVVDERSPDTIYGTLAIKLVGKTDFPVTSQPGATVIVRIADRDFGPYTADAAGRAMVPLTVPPGVPQATLISVVGGARAEEPLPLQLPETSRLAFFPTWAAVPGDPQGAVTLRVAVVTKTGQPDPNAQLQLSTNSGQISAPVHEGQGIYKATFTPAPTPAGGAAVIQASLQGEPTNLGASLSVPLAPARAASITQRAEPNKLGQTTTSFNMFTRVAGVDGAGLSGRELVFSASGAQVAGAPRDLRSGDYETTFTTTGPESVLVTGTVASPVTGNPVRHVVLVPSAERVANDGTSSAAFTVLTVDAFGYPVPNTTVTLKLESGDGQLARQTTTDARGMARVFYTAGSAAGVVNVKASAGDIVGHGGLLQLPAGVVPGLDLPVSGSAATVAIGQRLEATNPSLLIPRAGAAAVAQVNAADTPSAAVGPLTALTATAQPSMVAPGGSVQVTILAKDANGRAVPGEKVQILANGGTATPPQPRGDGSYTSTLTVPPGATGQVMVIVSNSTGSVTGALNVPINGSAWGQPVAETPVTTTAPAVSTAAPATTTTTTTTTTMEPPKPPREPGDFPMLRVRAGFAAGGYSYSQVPTAADSPLWPESVNVGAYPMGFAVDAQGWLPMLEYVGAELQTRNGFYAVDWLGDGSAIINDLLPSVSVMAAGRYPIDLDGSRISIGGKVGLLYGDFITYQQPSEDELTWDALPLAGVGLGAEAAFEMGDRFFVEADYILGLRGSPFAHNVGVDLGVGITGPLYLSAGFDWSARNTEVVSAGSGALLGTLSDQVIAGIIGPGLQF